MILAGTVITGITELYDADAQAFITAAGITNTTQQGAINTLVVQLKANSLWTNMQAIYPYVGGTAASHKYNLKDPRDLDAAFRLEYRGSSVTHSANGITTTGTGYCNTFCVPGSVLNRSYGDYIRIATNDGWSGSYIGNAFGFKVNTSPAVTAVGVNNLQGLGNSIVYGYLTSSILSASSGFLFNNSTTKFTNTSVASSPAAGVIYIGALNQGTTSAGTPWSEYGNRTLSFTHLSNGLTSAQHSTLVTIVQAYQTTLGRNV